MITSKNYVPQHTHDCLPHRANLIFWTDASLLGKWTSRRCETRPRSLFLTRELFFSVAQSWEARYHFFLDEVCSKAHFSVRVAGRYNLGGRSQVVPGGWELRLSLLNATVTPKSRQITAELSTSGCGTRPWKTREPQQLKFGCSAIGLKVPADIKELARIEESTHGIILLLGLTSSETNKQMEGSTKAQVTSYDAPLFKVPIQEVHRNHPETSVSLKEMSQRQNSTQATSISAKTANMTYLQKVSSSSQPVNELGLHDEVSEPHLAAALLQSSTSASFTSSSLLQFVANLYLLSRCWYIVVFGRIRFWGLLSKHTDTSRLLECWDF